MLDYIVELLSESYLWMIKFESLILFEISPTRELSLPNLISAAGHSTIMAYIVIHAVSQPFYKFSD